MRSFALIKEEHPRNILVHQAVRVVALCNVHPLFDVLMAEIGHSKVPGPLKYRILCILACEVTQLSTVQWFRQITQPTRTQRSNPLISTA